MCAIPQTGMHYSLLQQKANRLSINTTQTWRTHPQKSDPLHQKCPPISYKIRCFLSHNAFVPVTYRDLILSNRRRSSALLQSKRVPRTSFICKVFFTRGLETACNHSFYPRKMPNTIIIALSFFSLSERVDWHCSNEVGLRCKEGSEDEPERTSDDREGEFYM